MAPALALGLALTIPRNAGGGGGPATYDGLVATHIRIPDFQQASSFPNAMCRTGCKATEDLTSIKVAWANFWIFTGNPSGSGGTMTIVDAAVEYPIGSARQRLLFGGANSSSAIADGRVGFSDYLTLNTTIPKGAIFRIWFYQQFGGTTGVLKRATGGDTTTYGDNANAGTAATPATNTVMSGAAPTSNLGVGAYVPVAAVIGRTVNKSVIIVGDSIAWAGIGAGGPDIPENINGRIGLIAHSFPDDLPFLNLASSAATAQTFMSVNAGRVDLFPYCSHMVDELGINDIRSNTLATTVVGYKQAIAAAFPARVKKYAVTLGPTNASSTDGFTTVANQTIDTIHKTQADAFNAAVRSVIPGFDGYFDTSDVISSSRDSGKWAVATATTPRGVTDAATTAGQPTITSATANFTSADVGTGMTIAGAGVGGANLIGYISAVTNSTTVTLNGNASIAVTGATAWIGSNSVDGLHPTPDGYELVKQSGIITFT